MKVITLVVILVIVILVTVCCGGSRDTFTNKHTKHEEDIKKCFAEVMTQEEDRILSDLIDAWSMVTKELNIRWSICAGTYIGAIRNGGRIPWDDDFDVTVLKEDIPKLEKMGDILAPLSISVAKFWGGYKIFYNDNRAVTRHDKYGWNWPFIDIFTCSYGVSKECYALDKSELPLREMKFGNTKVFVAENMSSARPPMKTDKWKTELIDTGYRHRLEGRYANGCETRPVE